MADEVANFNLRKQTSEEQISLSLSSGDDVDLESFPVKVNQTQADQYVITPRGLIEKEVMKYPTDRHLQNDSSERQLQKNTIEDSSKQISGKSKRLSRAKGSINEEMKSSITPRDLSSGLNFGRPKGLTSNHGMKSQKHSFHGDSKRFNNSNWDDDILLVQTSKAGLSKNVPLKHRDAVKLNKKNIKSKKLDKKDDLIDMEPSGDSP